MCVFVSHLAQSNDNSRTTRDGLCVCVCVCVCIYVCMCFSRPYRAYRQTPCRAHKSGQDRARPGKGTGYMCVCVCVCVCVCDVTHTWLSPMMIAAPLVNPEITACDKKLVILWTHTQTQTHTQTHRHKHTHMERMIGREREHSIGMRGLDTHTHTLTHTVCC